MPSRYRFHGHAIGAGGRINHPFHEFINVQAASALPEIGGHGSARSTDFHYRDILHIRHAYTEVTGTRADGPKGKPIHKSLIRAQIEGLDIMGMVTADRIEARLVSFTDDESDGEPCFKFTGSYFQNLKIAGVPVKVDLAVDVFDRLHKHRLVQESFRKKKEFHSHYHAVTLKDKLKEAPERVQRWFQQAAGEGAEMPHVEGVTALTLVRGIQPETPAFKCWGHVIYIEGFGTIHLAELNLSKHKRELTMLRVDLGSPVDGTLDIGTSSGGGSTY